jgi:large subunit ribosomal protein L25
MANRHALPAQTREILGKDVKRLRRNGQVPGVIYGPVIAEPLSVTVDMKELDRTYTNLGPNVLIDLGLGGSNYTVYMRHMSMDRLKKQPIHIEFFAPNMRAEITTMVPIQLVGTPGNDNGILAHGRESVEVRGLPDNLPSALEVDVSGLVEIDQVVHLRDVTIPEGVTLLTDPDEVVAKLGSPQLISETEEEVSAEELETAAGAGGAEASEGQEESGSDSGE